MKIRNKVKQICIVVFLLVFFAIFISGTGVKVLAQDYYHNAYDYVSTYGNSCRFDVVDGEGRIYFGTSAKKAASSSTRYRTIGWKANLYLNGGYQESVYFSLNGNYINLTSTVTNGGKEYNLYYISIDSLKNRFNNQDAINSGKGEVKLDAVMSVVNPNQASPNGSMDDSGNYNGEVYDTRDGIANARGWSDKSDFDSYFNKTPVGMYRTVTVTGSTGISGTSGSGKYIYGSFATISATCSNGYEFDKWSDTSKRGIRFGVVVTSDLSYTAYAKAKTYTISYKANGGTGAPDNQTKVHGKELTLSSTKPTRTGYIFDYWTGSNGKNYNPGGTFGANADTIMTAHWTPITYYVAYNKNKPSNASHDVAGTMTNSKHAYDNGIEGNGYTTALTANAYTLKGWSFKNWNTKSDNTGTKYFNGASINNLTSTDKAIVNMYAHWVPNVYMLICDDEGATTSGTPYFFERYDHGWYSDKDVKNAISTITVPKKIGYKFNGYKGGSGTLYVNASGQIVAANNSFATDGAYVYAQWIPNIYDITLNNQGAYDAGTAHIYEKYSTGFYSDSAASKVFANGKITIPKKYNYTFDGYWTQQNTYKTSRGEQIIKPDGTINNVNTKFTANTTLYAKWIPKDYKINLDNQGADVNKGTSAFHEKYGEFNYTGGISYNADTGISTIKFNYTGSTQYFVAPADGEYTLKVAGASGASVGATGGKGGTSTGKIQLKKGDTLRIVVGGAGTKYSGGYNMGGDYDNNGIESHFGGGGATDIRLNSSSVDRRIIVAGGGGGTAYYSHIDLYANGGDGGGTVGGRLSAVYLGASSTITPDSAVYNGSFYKYTSKLNSCGASQTSSYTFKKGEGENYILGKPDSGGNYQSWILKVSEAAKGSQAQIGGGGGYYSGAHIHGNCVVIGGIGGSGYTGGVTDGSMTTGTNSGNGYAIISFNAKEIGKTDFSCNINIPKKEGYTFDGYWTGKNGTGNEVIDNNGIVTTQPTYFHENPTANVNSDGEATLYANWTKDKYKFIYKANGGLTASKSDIITDNVSYNTSYHVRAVDGTFTREGYKLTGWKEKNTNGTWGKTWTANTNVNYNLTHSTTVYAQWQALDVNYTVNYYKENVNGSYTFVTSEKNRTAKSDSVISVAPTTNKEIFDSTGFTLNKDRTISAPAFESKASNGNVKVKINGNGSTVVNFYYSRNSYTLTLKTATNDKGFIKLLGAGDTCVKKIKYGDSVYIGAQLNKNYKFVAWKQTDGTVFSTTAAKRFTMPSNNLTLIAYSNSDATKPDGPPVTKKYTVKVQHYIQNSSGYTLYKTVNDSVEENTVYTPKQLSFNAGYHFYKAINAETQATVSRGFTVTGNVTVNVYYNRAKYQVVTDYYVDGALYKTLSEYAYYNDSYKVKGLSLTGYKIEKVDVPIYGSNPFTVKQNMTGENKIKVYYVPSTYTITFSPNGGHITDGGKSVDTAKRTVKYNNTDNNNVSSLKPQRTGYTFIGWYTAIKGGTQIYNAKGACNNDETHWKNNKWCGNSNLTVYAHWEANNQNLTFNANGGHINGNETIAVVTPTYDKNTFNNVEYLKPHKNGYIFKGWYTAKKDGTQIYSNLGLCKNDGTYWLNSKWHYTGDVTLYAQWTPITWTVKYAANGGSGTMADSTFTFHDPNSVLRKNEFTRKGYEFKYWYMSRVRDGKTEWFYGNADGGWIGPESWYEKGKNPAGTKLYALTDGHTFNASTLINGDVIIAHAQWLGLKAKICYHSEDGKNDIVKEYQVGAGQKFEIATDWWRKQMFKTAYEPGNCIFAGWTTIKGSTDDMYRENETVPDSLIIEHINETIDIYSIWDKPTVGIAPTNDNISFNCNGKTWYTDTIEFVAMGNDQRYNVIGFDYMLGGDTVSANYRTTNSERGLMHSFSTSQYYSEGLRKVLNKGEPFTVKIWSESSTATSGTPMGTSDMSITQYWIDFTAPGLTYSVDSSRNIKVTATDDESGVNTIDLQSYRNGQWVSVNKATASSSQYSQFTNTFNLTQADYRYRYRVTATDHLGNSKTSGEFYVVPLTLKTALSKLDGTKVYNGQTLEFIAGGDLNATITANIGGYAETVKYEFSNELGQVVDSHTVSYAADGNATETKQFLIPWQLPHNQNYFVKVTAYRGNESVSTTEYVKLIDIDFSKFRSNIIYQSGQHN